MSGIVNQVRREAMKEKVYDVSINIYSTITAKSKTEVLDNLRAFIHRHISNAKVTPMSIDIKEIKQFSTDVIFSIDPEIKEWKQEEG